MKTYYITGISGFVGKHVINELNKEKDIKIIGFTLPHQTSFSWLQDKHITLVKGNLLDKEDIYQFLSSQGEGEKIIIHIAGKITTMKNGDPSIMKINYDATKDIVDTYNQIGGFKKFIYISSVDAIARRKDREAIFEPSEYKQDLVEGIYSKSKALANDYIMKHSSIPYNIILPSAIFGPDDPFNAPINDAIRKFIFHKLPAITKGGYDIVDVRDVATGIVATIKLGKDNSSYLLTGHYTTVEDLIKLTGKINNIKPVTFKVPHFLIKMISPFIELVARLKKKTPLFTGFSMDCLMQNANYNHEKASIELGYTPRSLEVSILDTSNWMKENYLDK